MVVKHNRKSRKKLGYNKHSGLRRRGSGNRGGVGRAGQGKRCKQKKHKFMEEGKISYGKHGFSSKRRSVEAVSVGMLSEKASVFGEKKGDKYYMNMKNKKVIGSGVVNVSIVLSGYHSISEKAKNKIVKAGGEVVAK